MSVTFPVQGPLDPITVKLNDTNAHELAGSDTARMFVPVVLVANISSSSTTLDLETTDGTTHYYHAKGEAVAANSHVTFDQGFFIPKTFRLKATAANADRLDVTGSKTIVT